MTQSALAGAVDISPRHLSFVENGRSAPSRPLVQRLATQLQIPLRGQNELLLAAGFAPDYTEQALDDPGLAMIRTAISKVLAGHDPFPALVVDRMWNLVEANSALAALLEHVPASLRQEPCNMLRLSLHPDGLAPDIVNLPQWRENVLTRLARQMRTISGDENMVALYRELERYPVSGPGYVSRSEPETEGAVSPDVVVPMSLRRGEQVLSLFSTVTTFGTPRDITVHELTIEAFYPADDTSAAILRGLADERRNQLAPEVVDA